MERLEDHFAWDLTALGSYNRINKFNVFLFSDKIFPFLSSHNLLVIFKLGSGLARMVLRMYVPY